MGKQVEIEIHDLAFDGKSVGKMGGKVVFCDAGLPGEKVLVEIVKSKARFSQGKVVEILEKSRDRIPAVCEHFDVCGGCAWQDLKYDSQLGYKTAQVRECLQRIGHLDDVAIREIIGSEALFDYRNKMEFTFHGIGGGSFTLGLHTRGRYDEVFDLNRCHIQSDRASVIVGILRDFATRRQIEAYDITQHTGYLRYLIIREARATSQIMIILVTNEGPLPFADELVERLTSEVPEVTTVVHGETSKKASVATYEQETLLYGSGYIDDMILGQTFRISPSSFFQTNTAQAEVLYSTAFDILNPSAEESVLDLYCGTGTIGLALASRVKRVVGVELVAPAIVAARKNAELNGIENAGFFDGDVKDYLDRLIESDERFEVVIVDPPRAGLHPKALKKLLKLQPPRLLYISCNPATFARDAEQLVADGYQLPFVQPVDMFPHTKHIEMVGLFSRA